MAPAVSISVRSRWLDLTACPGGRPMASELSRSRGRRLSDLASWCCEKSQNLHQDVGARQLCAR